MQPGAPSKPEICNCLALRQATRHVSQFYDQFLAPTGLRGTQFSILARLGYQGPMTINALAAEIQAFVKTRLSAHEYPREVAFIPDMPMTTTGKVIRRLLRQRA